MITVKTMEQKEPNFYAAIKDAALLAVTEIAELRAERDRLLLQIEEIQKAWTHALSDGVDITAKSQVLLEATIRGKTEKRKLPPPIPHGQPGHDHMDCV